MHNRYLIGALKALAITVPLALVLISAAGEFSWRLTIVAAVIFAVLWILMLGKPPRRYDTPPSPDDISKWW
jgi:hypothetical protein